MGRGSIWLAVIGLFTALAAHGDVMVTKKGTYKGVFEGYRDSQFAFRTEKGEVLNEARVGVKTVECDKPCPVLLAIERKPPESAVFKKYEKLKFIFNEDGKDRMVFSRDVESVTVTRAGSDGRGAGSGGVLPMYDVSRLELAAGITAEQKAAVARYKAARESYSAFVAESSAIVAEMDRARGQSREQMLDRLRARKNEEQPIKNEYRAAASELLAAFPKLESDGSIGNDDELPAGEGEAWQEGPVQGNMLRGLSR